MPEPTPGTATDATPPAGAVTPDQTLPEGGCWLITDGQARLLDASSAAWMALPTWRDTLRLQQQRLTAPQHPRLLADALARASRQGRSAVALPRAHRLPLTLRLSVLHTHTAVDPACRPHPPRLHWLLRDPERWRLDPALAAELFGLTPAEARVAAALAEGVAAEQLALDGQVQPNTIRCHIKRLLAKTRTRRQAELVSLLLRSAAWEPAPLPASVPHTAAAPLDADRPIARTGNDSAYPAR